MPKIVGSPIGSKPARKPKPASTTARYSSEERKVLYLEPDLKLCTGENALTSQQAKDLLNWEDELSYTARMMVTSPEIKEEEAKFPEYLLKDENDIKIQCWNNSRNRPFEESWARRLAQDILNGHWKLNLENIIIGRTGQVLSGQHRLIGLVLAEQMRTGKQADHWKQIWSGPVTIETSVAVGADESPETTMTLDNVKPRSLADVLYTSDLFRDLNSAERKECSRMLDAAIDLLWKRVGAGKSEYSHYQTHSESKGFLERHSRILGCVKHLFEQNKDRVISNLKLSPGQCAASCYLMGSADSDPEKYRAEEQPNEKTLVWTFQDKAYQFWQDLAGGKLKPVTNALGSLVDEDTGSGGRSIEKLTVLAKAWGVYVEDRKIEDKDLELVYRIDDDGVTHLDEWFDFGGVDQGAKAKGSDPEITEDEVEKKKIEERKARAVEIAERLNAKRRLQDVASSNPVKSPPAAKAPPTPKGASTNKTNDREPVVLPKQTIVKQASKK